MSPAEPQREIELVSIVIINHNYGRYLGDAIDSALVQSYPYIQVIVVDDGSTDDSGAVWARYGSKIHVQRLKPGGHSAAVNAGYAASQGRYLVFLDADDFLYPDCIRQCVAAIQPADAKVQFQLATVDASGIDQNMPFPYFGPMFTPAKILRQALLSGWYPWTVSSGNLFSRNYIAELLPLDPTEIYRSPDGYLSKLAPLYGSVRSLSQVLGAYRVHGANAWATDKGAWTIDTALRWLKFDIVLERRFLAAAAARGLTPRRPLLPSFHQLEYRILALRFAPNDTPYPADSRRHLLALGLAWLAFVRPDGFLGSAGRLAWLVFVAIAPIETVGKELQRARSQANRSGFWSRALQFTRGGKR